MTALRNSPSARQDDRARSVQVLGVCTGTHARSAEQQWGVEFEDGEVQLITDTSFFTLRTEQQRAEDIAREQGGTVVVRWVYYSRWESQP